MLYSTDILKKSERQGNQIIRTKMEACVSFAVTSDPQELPCVLQSADGRVQRRAGRVSPVEAAGLFIS